MFPIYKTSIEIMDECLVLSLNFYQSNFFLPLFLINWSFMKHNLIPYDITFVE
jgi:hypothetical protein